MIGGKRVQTLMIRMGIHAVYRKPRTSHRDSAYTVYPYLLRDLTITRSNHAWTADIMYSTPNQRSSPVWG
jgi:putative transposase